MVATIARYGARFDQWAASVCDLPPAEQLVEYLEIGRLVVARKRVCALAMLTSQLEAVPAEVADITRETQARILAFYVHALDAAREAGAIRFEGSPQDMAVQTACAVTGAQQLAKAMGPQVYDQVCRQLLANLGLLRPACPTQRPPPPSRPAGCHDGVATAPDALSHPLTRSPRDG